MKKNLFLLGSIFSIGLFTTTFGINTYAMEEETVSNENEEQTEYTGDENPLNPAVIEDGDIEGENDQSTVNIQIKKVAPFSVMGAGEWDYIGYSSFSSQSKTFYSGGGNVKILIKQPGIGPGFTWQYKLVEDDPYTFDDTVADFRLPNGAGTYEVTYNVSSFVDGDNKKAELYLKKLTNPTYSVGSEWYDWNR